MKLLFEQLEHSIAVAIGCFFFWTRKFRLDPVIDIDKGVDPIVRTVIRLAISKSVVLHFACQHAGVFSKGAELCRRKGLS